MHAAFIVGATIVATSPANSQSFNASTSCTKVVEAMDRADREAAAMIGKVVLGEFSRKDAEFVERGAGSLIQSWTHQGTIHAIAAVTMHCRGAPGETIGQAAGMVYEGLRAIAVTMGVVQGDAE